MKYKYLEFDPARFKSLFNPNRTFLQKKKFLAFAIAVAGKTATQTAGAMDMFIKYGKDVVGIECPFAMSYHVDQVHGRSYLNKILKFCSIGCMSQRSEAFIDAYMKIHNNGFDLDDIPSLEQIKGVGQKTSRFFVLYNYWDRKCAALDTHIWKMLGKYYADRPKNIPSGRNYLTWEERFVKLIETEQRFKDMSFAELDFHGWDAGRKGEFA